MVSSYAKEVTPTGQRLEPTKPLGKDVLTRFEHRFEAKAAQWFQKLHFHLATQGLQLRSPDSVGRTLLIRTAGVTTRSSQMVTLNSCFRGRLCPSTTAS